MAEEEAVPETITERNNSSSEDMDLENLAPAPNPKDDTESDPRGVDSATNGDSNSKRAREEGTEPEEEDKGDGAKKQKVDKSVEEERLEKLDDSGVVEGEGGEEEVEKEKEKESDRVSVGPKNFLSSAEMFDYFYKFLHYWPPNLNVNEYEHMVLLDLLKKGHSEPDKKIGGGIHAFQVRYHPMWKSRCFFLVREDESVDDFSFRKCVDHILPLPEDMKVKSDVNKALGGGGGGGGRGGRGGGRGGSRGRGRGGRWRN